MSHGGDLTSLSTPDCSQITCRANHRIELAGDWTDLPPYCDVYGGRLINMAISIPDFIIEVNASKIDSLTIELSSLDRNASEVIASSSQLKDDGPTGPLFLGKSTINGFLKQSPWPEDLGSFLRNCCGGGIRLVTRSTAPSGAGLGSSSILSTAIWKVVSHLIGMPLEPQEACWQSFLMESSLGLGSGWQDQIGGVIAGIKDIHYQPGGRPVIRSVPTTAEFVQTINTLTILAYTGGTRYSGDILNQVNDQIKTDNKTVRIIDDLKSLCDPMMYALKMGDYPGFGRIVREINVLEQRLHPRIVPERIGVLMQETQPHFHGAKMCGAGGEGFLAFFTKGIEEKKYLTKVLENSSMKVYSVSIGTGMEIHFG